MAIMGLDIQERPDSFCSRPDGRPPKLVLLELEDWELIGNWCVVSQFCSSSPPKQNLPGKVESPHWSYQLGLQEGWLPSDPRSGAGTCAKQGIVSPLGKSLAGYQTGGPGAGTFLQPQVSSYGQWPPSSMSGVTAMSGLPVYVQTGTPITLMAPTPTSYAPSYSPTVTISVGNGWADPSDTVGAYVPIAGCNYPNAWSAVSSPYPQCTPSVQKRRKQNILGTSTASSLPTITPRPKL